MYFGKLLLEKWLRQNLASIHDKKVFLFSVSGTPPDRRQELDGIIQQSIPAEIRTAAEIYFFPGKMDMASLSWLDRLLIKMGARMTKDPVVKKEMLRDYNDIRKQHIYALTQAVLKFCFPVSGPDMMQASKPQGLSHKPRG